MAIFSWFLHGLGIWGWFLLRIVLRLTRPSDAIMCQTSSKDWCNECWISLYDVQVAGSEDGCRPSKDGQVDNCRHAIWRAFLDVHLWWSDFYKLPSWQGAKQDLISGSRQGIAPTHGKQKAQSPKTAWDPSSRRLDLCWRWIQEKRRHSSWGYLQPSWFQRNQGHGQVLPRPQYLPFSWSQQQRRR